MAQIAIPLVIAGVFYLISNDKKESFMESHAPKEDNIIQNSIEKTSLNTNNQGIYTQYQDKYSSVISKPQEFTNLAGQKVTEMNHNNMTMFYNNKSNGAYSQQAFNKNDNTLDNYTGSGSNIIEKSEVASFFKPTENMQNVWGNQNQSDFFQSRVVESKKFANTKPWEEVREAPGQSGFNSGMENRDKWIDKTVDELRITNNPKSNYLQNYVPPAYKAADRGIIGKVIKKSQDTFYINQSIANGGAGGNVKGTEKPMQVSEQMLTDGHREHTSSSYFGAQSTDTAGYIKGEHCDPHKPELPTNPYINLAANQVFPDNDHGKESYKSYSNNRNTEGEYLGAVKGLFMANVVNPIVNGLRPTKKTNFVENSNPTGFVNGMKQQMIYNENNAPVTNRQIQANRIGMNYLQVDRQSSDGYMTANPYLIGQQRESTNVGTVGIAGGISGATSYNAEYNQRSFQKPIDNRTPIGNTSTFNNVINATINGREVSNTVVPSMHNPYGMAARIMPSQTTMPQEYENINEGYNHSDLLKAFKSNPYTKPLSSVA